MTVNRRKMMNGWIRGGVVARSGWSLRTRDPCDEYVDYMCSCHGEEIDCNDLSLTYDGAAPDVQDECAVLLDDVEQADQDAGAECVAS